MKTFRLNRYFNLALTAALFPIAAPDTASAFKDCDLLKIKSIIKDLPSNQPELAAIEQLVEWENGANFSDMTRDVQVHNLSSVLVSRKTVEIEIAKNTPAGITNLFVGDNQVLWPKHWANTDLSIPHATETGYLDLRAYSTASRSMIALTPEKVPYSIKLPTSHPNPEFEEPTKADMRSDVEAAVWTTNFIEKQNQKLNGPDPSVIILRDVLAISDKKTGNGFVVRDLSSLLTQDFDYLPAFSIPYIGGEIAKRAGKAFDSMWAKYYAQPLGTAKARLLLLYGLQLKSPNAQNMLLQIDKRTGLPTRVIVFRDLTDTTFHNGVVDAIGEQAALKRYPGVDELHPEAKGDFSDSFESFNISLRYDTVDKALTDSVVEYWRTLHLDAYLMELNKRLKLPIPRAGLTHEELQEELKKTQKFLSTDAGKAAVKNAREALKAEHK